MTILAVRTDNPLAELYLYEDDSLLKQESWQAHRELSATIHTKLVALLASAKKQLDDIQGIIFYQGPGSFTGLRIGISVVNALGNSLHIPVVATKGDFWLQDGFTVLKGQTSFTPVEPYYGVEAITTTPKK